MKTTKLIILITLLTCTPIIVNAQFFVELNTGYAAPINFLGYDNKKQWHTSNYRYYDNTQGIDSSYYILNKFNMGNGLFLNGEFGYKLNDRFEFSLKIAYLNNYNLNFAYNPFTRETVREGYTYWAEDSISSLYSFNKEYSFYGKRLSFIPKVSYLFIYNKITIQPSLGFSISYITLYKNTELNIESIDKDSYSSYNSIEKLVWKEYFKKNNHFGAYLSLAVLYEINPKIDLKFGFESNLLLASQIENGIQYYYSRQYELNDELMVNSVDNDEQTSATDKEYFNFNTLNFSLGIRYTFGTSQNMKEDN